MANNTIDRNIKLIKKKYQERRVSIIPDNTKFRTDNLAETVQDIVIITELKSQVSKDPDTIMKMLDDIRLERDTFLVVSNTYLGKMAEYKRIEKAFNKAGLKEEIEGDYNDPLLQSPLQPPLPPFYTRKEKKTIKLPDPPFFTDGSDPKWDDWVAKIDEKLDVNNDYFLTEKSKIVYIISRLGGKAIIYIINR